MSRFLGLAYGMASYVAFLAAFLYAIGFVGNLVVPRSIDLGPEAPLGRALFIDVLLLGAFAIQHSVMARRGFKAWWTRFVPSYAERSTYVLVSSLLLGLVYWQWRPITAVVWDVGNPAAVLILHALFALGWLVVLSGSFMIDHFDLFGLRQVYLHFLGRPYTPIEFKAPMAYRLVRHPLMVGFIVAFWATPRMTAGHLLFAALTTGYVLIALQFEERDLAHAFGEAYREYQRKVRMLLPWPK